MNRTQTVESFMCSLAGWEAYERACAGKDPFPSKNAAETFAKLMHQGRLTKTHHMTPQEWASLEPYKCGFCEAWHLGHVK